jgi:hypothetical protein
MVPMWARLGVVLLAATAAPLVQAKVTVPRWFGDNMVFQVNAEYGARSFLNGLAKPGEKVTVTFDGTKHFPAVADASGEWEVQFNGGGVGHGPGNVSIVGEEGPPITATNVRGTHHFPLSPFIPVRPWPSASRSLAHRRRNLLCVLCVLR